jgi:hypothetical protein
MVENPHQPTGFVCGDATLPVVGDLGVRIFPESTVLSAVTS